MVSQALRFSVQACPWTCWSRYLLNFQLVQAEWCPRQCAWSRRRTCIATETGHIAHFMTPRALWLPLDGVSWLRDIVPIVFPCGGQPVCGDFVSAWKNWMNRLCSVRALPAAQQHASAAEIAVASLEWADLESANGGCAVRLESAVAYIFRVTSRSLIIVTTHAGGFAWLRRGPRGPEPL